MVNVGKYTSPMDPMGHVPGWVGRSWILHEGPRNPPRRESCTA